MKFSTVAVFGFSALCILLSVAMAEDPTPIDPSKGRIDAGGFLMWYDAALLPTEGQGWTDTEAPYDRLPARAKNKVRKVVWDLSRNSSGIAIPFSTDAREIHARWTLTSKNLAMPIMSASGMSGLDLYVRDSGGTWKWLAATRPEKLTNTATLVSRIPPGNRSYLLYLPLYNGISSLEIGIPKKNLLTPALERVEGHRKPIVFYGTSITQGASASRPGMTHVAILGRRFDRPVINLGFAGNGQLETEVAEFLAELDPAVYVIDCLPNITAKEVQERTKPCVGILRNAHPITPIVLVEDRTYADAFLVKSRRKRNSTSRAALHQVYKDLRQTGDDNLFYLEGDRLLEGDNEATVEGSHPTDLGFVRQADAFTKVLEPILGKRVQ